MDFQLLQFVSSEKVWRKYIFHQGHIAVVCHVMALVQIRIPDSQGIDIFHFGQIPFEPGKGSERDFLVGGHSFWHIDV